VHGNVCLRPDKLYQLMFARELTWMSKFTAGVRAGLLSSGASLPFLNIDQAGFSRRRVIPAAVGKGSDSTFFGLTPSEPCYHVC